MGYFISGIISPVARETRATVTQGERNATLNQGGNKQILLIIYLL